MVRGVGGSECVEGNPLEVGMKSISTVFAGGLFCVVLSGCTLWSKAGGDRGSAYIEARVVRISEEYANINTDVGRAELRKVGIGDKSVFTMRYRDHTIRAFLGEGYGDVARGEWVALIEEDGKLQLAISYGNAATEIGCAVGDTLHIER